MPADGLGTDAAEEEVPMPVQSSDSPHMSAHHDRASRIPASEDAIQVTSPIREKTELEGILAQARCTEQMAASGAPKAEGMLAADADIHLVEVSSTSTTHALSAEAESSPTEPVSISNASEVTASPDTQATADEVISSEVPEDVTSNVAHSAPAIQNIEQPQADRQAKEESEQGPFPTTQKSVGNAKTLDEPQAGHSGVAVDQVLPEEESQLLLIVKEELWVAVPPAVARCSNPFYGPDSPARVLESLDSPLLQATLEEPSPAQITLQVLSPAHSTGTPLASSSPAAAASPAADTPSGASGEQETTGANGYAGKATPMAVSEAAGPSLDLHSVKTSQEAAVVASSDAAQTQSDTLASATAADAESARAAAVVAAEVSGEAGLTPELSPSAERLVSERSLDEAEYTLLREVMSKDLDPADQVRPCAGLASIWWLSQSLLQNHVMLAKLRLILTNESWTDSKTSR